MRNLSVHLNDIPTWSLTIDVGTPNQKTVTMSLAEFLKWKDQRSEAAKSIYVSNMLSVR